MNSNHIQVHHSAIVDQYHMESNWIKDTIAYIAIAIILCQLIYHVLATPTTKPTASNDGAMDAKTRAKRKNSKKHLADLKKRLAAVGTGKEKSKKDERGAIWKEINEVKNMMKKLSAKKKKKEKQKKKKKKRGGKPASKTTKKTHNKTTTKATQAKKLRVAATAKVAKKNKAKKQLHNLQNPKKSSVLKEISDLLVSEYDLSATEYDSSDSGSVSYDSDSAIESGSESDLSNSDSEIETWSNDDEIAISSDDEPSGSYFENDKYDDNSSDEESEDYEPWYPVGHPHCSHSRTRNWGNQHGSGKKCLICGDELSSFYADEDDASSDEEEDYGYPQQSYRYESDDEYDAEDDFESDGYDVYSDGDDYSFSGGAWRTPDGRFAPKASVIAAGHTWERDW